MKTRHAYIIGSARIPFVKSLTNYINIMLQELMTVTLQALINKMHLEGQVLGDVALGHPFAATGARILGTLAKILQQKGSGRGLISICTAGGMGVATILEAVQ